MSADHRGGLVRSTVIAGLVCLGAVACGGSAAEPESTQKGAPEQVLQGPAASCVGPTLQLNPEAAPADATVQASGEWFAADCYDTGQGGTPPPLEDLTIEVRQGDRSWPVATGVDAGGDHYTFEVPIRLPEDLQPGSAEVAVKGYVSATADVRVLP
jgi:hypothetical protein